MNFFNQFVDQWNTRFEGNVVPPQLEYLKADQFGSLVEQKRALENQKTDLYASIEELKQQLYRKSFTVEYVHKCIQKLSAVSQVFNEFEQCDSKSSSSSGTNNRFPGPSASPNTSLCEPLLLTTNKCVNPSTASTFPFFPQSITSSLIHSASPLFAAAAATSASHFLLPSAIPSFPYTESLKLEPDSETLPVRSSSFFLPSGGGDRITGYASPISRLATGSTNSSYATQYQNQNTYSSDCYTSTVNYQLANDTSPPFCSTRTGADSYEHDRSAKSMALIGQTTPATLTNPGTNTIKVTTTNNNEEECADAAAAAAAAHAVVAALGFDIRSAAAAAAAAAASSNPCLHAGAVSNCTTSTSSQPQSQLLPTAAGVATTTTPFLQSPPINGLDNNNKVPSPGLLEATSASISSANSDRPYQCETCLRSFAVKAGLVQHMRTHTDERPYPCQDCGRAFKQKIQLTTHMRVHSGERPYGCRLCGKLFRQQSHVVQHLRTHTGEKPHKCYQCGKAFRQKYSLISHLRRMCRNRATANPIAAGMTMWISPGAGGDTCNLVKEFSPTKAVAAIGAHTLPKTASCSSSSTDITSPLTSANTNNNLSIFMTSSNETTSTSNHPVSATLVSRTNTSPLSPFLVNSSGLLSTASRRPTCSVGNSTPGSPSFSMPSHRLLSEFAPFRQKLSLFSTNDSRSQRLNNTTSSYQPRQHLSTSLCSSQTTRVGTSPCPSRNTTPREMAGASEEEDEFIDDDDEEEEEEEEAEEEIDEDKKELEGDEAINTSHVLHPPSTSNSITSGSHRMVGHHTSSSSVPR